MHLKFTGLVVICVTAFAGVIWWFTSQSSSQIDQMTRDAASLDRSPRPSVDQPVVLPQGTGSLVQLRGQLEPAECTFTFITDDGVPGEGTAFVADDRVRIDAMVVRFDETYVTRTIVAADRLYMWGDMGGGDFAVTMSVTNDHTAQPFRDELPFGLDDQVAYACRSWTVDGSVFAPPAAVQFLSADELWSE